MKKEVEFISFIYPDTINVKINDKVHTFLTSEYWARKAMVQMRFGEGWKGINILKKNGKEVRKENND